MTGKSHFILSTVSAVSIVLSTDYFTSMEGLFFTVGSMAGSLFPDIDAKNSTISHKMPVFGFFTRIIFGHRQLIHTPFGMCLFIVCLGCLRLIVPVPISFIIGFGMGYLCHLIQEEVLCGYIHIPTNIFLLLESEIIILLEKLYFLSLFI